jgi:hypothetical protein
VTISWGIKDLNARFKLVTSTTLLASAATVVFSLPGAALAQGGAAGALLEEIVTTARKRSEAEAVQDVPIAVTHLISRPSRFCADRRDCCSVVT